MKPSFSILSTLLLLTCANSAWAYPIFYKCDAQRRMTESLTGPELNDQLRKFLESAQGNPEQAITSLCQGVNECERQMGQILSLAQVDRKIAEKLFEDELKRLYRENPAQASQKLDEASFETQKKLMSATFENAACRATVQKLPASSFTPDQKVLFYYPKLSEYSYVTGCRLFPSQGQYWACSANNLDVLKQGIRNALTMGADPYAAVAIGLMEGGQNGIGGLYLDPIGKYRVLGCKEGNNPGKLHSFGNMHDILPGLIENPDLSSRLESAMKTSQTAQSGKSYLCRALDHDQAQILSTPDSGSCCLALSFTPSSTQLLEKALTFEHVRQVCNDPKPLKDDPAFRVQRFNGFSHLMGGAEGVSTFRMGADYYQDPAYGYQAMDFILNSLLTNPAMHEMVDEIAKETGATYQSILCQDVAVPGAYQIDSDHYFRKHRDTPRLLSLKGKKFEEMTPRQRKVLSQELNDPTVRPKMEKKFSGSLPGQFGFGGMNNQQFTTETSVVFPDGTGIKGSETVGPGANPATSSVVATGGYRGPLPPSPSSISQQALDKKKASEGYTLEADEYGGHSKKEITFFGGFVDKHAAEISTNWGPQAVGAHTMSWSGGKMVVTVNPYKMEYFDAQGKPTSMPHMSDPGEPVTVTLADGSGFRIKTTFQPMPMASTTPTASPSGTPAPKMINAYKITYADQSVTKITVSSQSKTLQAPAPDTKIEDWVKYYFEEIYPNRSTISKASDLPWSTMTDENLRIIAEKIGGGKPVGTTGYMGGGSLVPLGKPGSSF